VSVSFFVPASAWHFLQGPADTAKVSVEVPEDVRVLRVHCSCTQPAEDRSAMAKSYYSCVETQFFPGSRHCALVLQTQVPKLCIDLDLSLLYILTSESYSKFAPKNNFLALGVCFPQPQAWVCRIKITFTELPTNLFVCTTKKSMKCVVNWIPRRIRVRSKNTQPHLNHEKNGGVEYCVCFLYQVLTLFSLSRGTYTDMLTALFFFLFSRSVLRHRVLSCRPRRTLPL